MIEGKTLQYFSKDNIGSWVLVADADPMIINYLIKQGYVPTETPECLKVECVKKKARKEVKPRAKKAPVKKKRASKK